MNIFTGIIRFDGKAVDPQDLKRCVFSSPHWCPDHQGTLIEGSMGFLATQRLIKKNALRWLQPYRHAKTGCILLSDSYLTNAPSNQCDAETIMAAYLQWGGQCTHHLLGYFLFALWDPRIQELLIATDHTGQRPCFYAYQPHQYLIFSNTMAPFKILLPNLKINQHSLMRFTLDSPPESETAYQQVSKLLPAHQLTINSKRLHQHCYWQLNKHLPRLPQKTAHEYYATFRTCFESTVQHYLNTDFPILSAISGGLDSSAVTSQAAKLLMQSNQRLYAFTALPSGLEGCSYRKGWKYHEMPIIQAVLNQYPNIVHHAYFSDPSRCPFETLKTLYPLIDQPIRNSCNFDWIIGSLSLANRLNCRVQLVGHRGNATISWAGETFRGKMSYAYRWLQGWIKPEIINRHHKLYSAHQPHFLKSQAARHYCQTPFNLKPHYAFLTHPGVPGLLSTLRATEFYYGIELLDPTHDRSLMEHCHQFPQWVYCQNRGKLGNRLLVRQGLQDIVPPEIRQNPYRGEQAADWYLHYNHHRQDWMKSCTNVWQGPFGDILSQWYCPEKIHQLFIKYPHIEQNTEDSVCEIRYALMRFMSLARYLGSFK